MENGSVLNPVLAPGVKFVRNRDNPGWGCFEFIYSPASPGSAILRRGHRSVVVNESDFSRWLIVSGETEETDRTACKVLNAFKMLIKSEYGNTSK